MSVTDPWNQSMHDPSRAVAHKFRAPLLLAASVPHHCHCHLSLAAGNDSRGMTTDMRAAAEPRIRCWHTFRTCTLSDPLWTLLAKQKATVINSDEIEWMNNRWWRGELRGSHVGAAHDYETRQEHQLYACEICRWTVGWDLLFEQ